MVFLISKRFCKIFNSFIKLIKPDIITNFSGEIENIIEILKKENEIKEIGKCKKKLNDLNINIDEKDNPFFDILINLSENLGSISFLFRTTIDDCASLQELASQNENSHVLVNDILELQKCIEFFNNVGKFDELKKKSDKEIINILKENAQNQKDISIYIKNYVNNYIQIKLLKSSFNQSEVLQYKIEAILKESIFYLSNSKENMKYFCNDKKYMKEDLISLRERVHLSKKITKEYKYFIEKAEEIITISNLLQLIYNKGYPEIIQIQINFENINNIDIEKYYKCNYFYIIIKDKINTNYKEIFKNLNNIIIILKTKHLNSYIKKPLLRYIYGIQFTYLNEFFVHHIKDINHFLKYITNDLYQKEINFEAEQKGEIIERNINNCEKYIKELFEKNNLKLKEIYKNTIIKQVNNNEKYQGIYIYLTVKLEKE